MSKGQKDLVMDEEVVSLRVPTQDQFNEGK